MSSSHLPIYWQCHGISSRLPLAYSAVSASNTRQTDVGLWVVGAWLLNQ